MYTIVKKLSLVKKAMILALIIGLAGAGVWAYTFSVGSIYTYSANKDRDFIINLFKDTDNWYWLVSEGSTDFSVEYMLDNKASSKARGVKNDLIIKVYRRQGKPLGFVAYYTKDFGEGRILFVAVDKKERSKGYAGKLLQYAINALQERGCVVAKLITRTTNIPGQKLYTRMGFEKEWEHDGFVQFTRKL
jgi:ribosomal protein S18 acetylase RimI-like enzyme